MLLSNPPFPKWFCSMDWYLRYIIIVAIIYLPAIILTVLDGTFNRGEEKRCDISFVSDYTFHIIWLLSIPLFFALVKWFYSETDAVFEILSGTVPPIINAELKTKIASFHQGYISVIIGGIAGVLVAGTVAFFNLKSLKSNIETGQTTWSWWLPSGHFCPATVFFFLICGLVTCGGLIVIIRYVYDILSIREAIQVLNINENGLPAWVASPEGPLWRFFRSFFIICLPLTLIPVCVWIVRTFRGNISISDPVSIFNMVILPVCVVFLIILPILITGVPAKLGRQRDKALYEITNKLNEVISKISVSQASASDNNLMTELEVLSRKKKLIEDYHYVWPLPSNPLRKFAFTTIPAIFSWLSSMSSFFKDLLVLLKKLSS